MSKYPFRALFSFLIFLSNAGATAGSPLYPSIGKLSVEITSEPVEEHLVMGPISAKFWSKIQMIVVDDDYIMNFPRLVDLFDLQIKEPIDAVSPNRPGIQSRRDATENSMRAKSMGYGVVANASNPALRDVTLSIDLNLDQICLTAREVERVFGKGRIAVTPHESASIKASTHPVEVHYSQAYPPESDKPGIAPLVFSYAHSGCVKNISLHRLLPAH